MADRQRALFDMGHPDMPATVFPPASRTSDPATSREAERRITKSGARRKAIDIVVELVRRFPGSTACELHARHLEDKPAAPLSRHDVSRRLPEAEREGQVIRGPARTCTAAGTTQMTWGVA